jgi:hypothetical protein
MPDELELDELLWGVLDFSGGKIELLLFFEEFE